MANNKHSSKRAIILVMIALSAVAVIVSYFYYGGKNRQVDPRVVQAREMYAEYNRIAGQNNYIRAFRLLDSIDDSYSSIDHYKTSFERGVLMNNRAAALITIAMIKDSTAESVFPLEYRNLEKEKLIDEAGEIMTQSIKLYDEWYKVFDRMNGEEIYEAISTDFLNGLNGYSQEEQDAFLTNRVDEIIAAVKEKDRRMSVSLTNLGMVYRHQEKYDDALKTYQQAVDLWDENLTAKNNINVLLGRPLEKRSPLRKIFPKDKDGDL